MLKTYNSGSQGVISEPAASASPGNFLEKQILKTSPQIYQIQNSGDGIQ